MFSDLNCSKTKLSIMKSKIEAKIVSVFLHCSGWNCIGGEESNNLSANLLFRCSDGLSVSSILLRKISLDSWQL